MPNVGFGSKLDLLRSGERILEPDRQWIVSGREANLWLMANLCFASLFCSPLQSLGCEF